MIFYINLIKNLMLHFLDKKQLSLEEAKKEAIFMVREKHKKLMEYKKKSKLCLQN